MVVHSCYPEDTRVRREAEALIGAGHQVDVVCLKKRSEPFLDRTGGVRVHRMPIRHRRSNSIIYIIEYIAFFLLAAFYLSFLHLKKRFDLVHVHNMPNFLVFTALLPRLFGAKVILDMHDPMPEIYQAHFNVGPDHWLVRLLRLEEALSCRFADYLITVTEPMRDLILQRGFDSRYTEVVMNLPDSRIFDPHRISLKKREDNHKKFNLVYTGLVSHRNGLDTAIEGVNILRKEMPDLCLMIIGNGPHLPELRSMVERYGLNDNVIFREPVMIDQIPEILSDCEIGISPHQDNAFAKLMFATKVAEYLSLSLPVISARTLTMEYYYKDSALFFFEPGNAEDLAEQVKVIRQHPELVETKKIAAKEIMSRLTWAEESKKFLKLVADWGAAREN